MKRVKYEMKNDLVAAFNEISEVFDDLDMLGDFDLMDKREVLKVRISNALYWLGKYVSDEDVLKG